MHARNLLNLVLLAAVIGLGALLWLEPGQKPAPSSPPQLMQIDGDHVAAIRIQQREHPAIVLEKIDGQWRMTAPVKVAANRFRIDSLLDALKAHSLGSFDAPGPEALAQYGLAPPAVTVTVDHTAIAFGAVTPVDQRRYVKLGERIHLIPDTLFFHVAGDFPTFVTLSPLGAAPRIAALRLPGFAVTHADGRWQATTPGASADDLNTLLDAWRNLQAIQVVRRPDGPIDGEIEVQLEGADAPVKLLIAKQGSGLTLIRPELGLAWQLPASARADLLALPHHP